MKTNSFSEAEGFCKRGWHRFAQNLNTKLKNLPLQSSLPYSAKFEEINPKNTIYVGYINFV
jgi:hypothetical protein